jgi:hypothetical protein
MPDPDRLGGIGWTRRTKGTLTGAERRKLLAAVAKAQGDNALGRLRLLTGRATRAADYLPDPPDSAFAKDVQTAADEQPPAIVAHSYRTWAFGSALAKHDGHDLDPEAFWCATLLHDAGIASQVPQEDFTLRSAAAATKHADNHGRGDGELIADAITVHTTAGISPESDGALGAYVQAGAMLDLGGVRLWDVSERLVDQIAQEHGRADLTPYINAEAKAVPKGRFALLRACGFTLMMRVSPLRK